SGKGIIMADKFDADKALVTIRRFISGKLLQSGLDGYIVGMSGGIDSSLAAALAVEAVGKAKVFGMLMPYRTSSESAVKDALEVVTKYGFEYKQIDISPMIDAYFPEIDESNRIRAGNKMARERMSIVFDVAHQMQRLVLGTSNRTEIALGYTTWYGDSACSINPIGQLYKTEVRQLAKLLGLPESVINKPPSADLWRGQTDEGEIGVTYNQMDTLLKLLVDDGVLSMNRLEENGFSSPDISRVVSLLNRNSFKRRLPDIAPLGRNSVPDNIQLED
ncbi:MAG TPA: NAD+ synthase, partial [candidate division Zixibacteria bacterium]|nr:NAD+ synthase [candidate division Zixibacteria bacterium]